MKIVVFGASGRVGSLLVEKLHDKGHELTVFVHTSGDFAESAKLRVIKGDIHNPEDVFNAVKNQDVVVSTLGSWGTKTKDIVSTATKNIIPAMEQYDVKRFVSVTGSAAKTLGEKLTFVQTISRLALLVFARPIVKDAETHLALLSHCNIDWTALRSPVMTRAVKTDYELGLKPSAPWAVISRISVVNALVELTEKEKFVRQAPFITKR